MTVPGETPAVPSVDRAAAEQQFTEVYAQHWDRIHRYIWRRLDVSQERLAEDLTQLVFLDLWTSFCLRGEDISHPAALLHTMARNKIGTYFGKQKNREAVVDLSDPVNTPIIATGHAYAVDTPDLASLGREFEQAMAGMEAASQAWRDSDKAWHRLRLQLKDETSVNAGGLTAKTRQRTQRQLDEAVTREAEDLQTFRAACRRVGQLRAELEAAGGANWRSSAGMPASLGTRPYLDGSRSDPTTTHCPAGHRLVRENTYFYADGDRDCRICRTSRSARADAGRRSPARAEGRRARSDTVPDDVLQKARDMLADPAYLTTRIVDIAAQCGMAQATLNARLGGEVSRLRQSAREAAGVTGSLIPRPRIDPEVIEQARRLLADPALGHSIRSVAGLLKVSQMSLYRAFPGGVAAVRQAALEAAGAAR